MGSLLRRFRIPLVQSASHLTRGACALQELFSSRRALPPTRLAGAESEIQPQTQLSSGLIFPRNLIGNSRGSKSSVSDFQQTRSIFVEVTNDDFDKALRRYKSKVREGIPTRVLRARLSNYKPSEIKRLRKKESELRLKNLRLKEKLAWIFKERQRESKDAHIEMPRF